jgi:signal transduction histidine kinase
VADDEKEELAAQYREELQAVLHDQVLPILEYLRDGGSVSTAVRREAGAVARDARTLLHQFHAPKSGASSLTTQVQMLVAAARNRGLDVTPSLALVGEPPPAVTTSIVSGTREVLNNVVKHARRLDGVSLYAEATADDVLVVVTDQGVGITPGTLRPDGGLLRSTAALRRMGGSMAVDAGPSGGTRVTLEWSAPPTPEDDP